MFFFFLGKPQTEWRPIHINDRATDSPTWTAKRNEKYEILDYRNRLCRAWCVGLETKNNCDFLWNEPTTVKPYSSAFVWFHLSVSILHVQFNNAKSNIRISNSSRTHSIQFGQTENGTIELIETTPGDSIPIYEWRNSMAFVSGKIKFSNEIYRCRRLKRSQRQRWNNINVGFRDVFRTMRMITYLCKPFIFSVCGNLSEAI